MSNYTYNIGSAITGTSSCGCTEQKKCDICSIFENGYELGKSDGINKSKRKLLNDLLLILPRAILGVLLI